VPRFVALLRGVNVGRAQRVPMATLRSLLQGLGGSEVQTLLNSGNAVFASAGRSPALHSKAIHAAIAAELGLDVPVVVRSAAEFDAIVAANPLAQDGVDPTRLLVAFAQDPALVQALAPALTPLLQHEERFFVGPQAAYLQCTGGILDSVAASALLGKVGRWVTSRNWATVLKLRQLLATSGPPP
jgi:uncharacterized protein (DUF1697 family)